MTNTGSGSFRGVCAADTKKPVIKCGQTKAFEAQHRAFCEKNVLLGKALVITMNALTGNGRVSITVYLRDHLMENAEYRGYRGARTFEGAKFEDAFITLQAHLDRIARHEGHKALQSKRRREAAEARQTAYGIAGDQHVPTDFVTASAS